MERERDCFDDILVQTYDVGLHSRRQPMDFYAGTRSFASFDVSCLFYRSLFIYIQVSLMGLFSCIHI